MEINMNWDIKFKPRARGHSYLPLETLKKQMLLKKKIERALVRDGYVLRPELTRARHATSAIFSSPAKKYKAIFN